MGTRGRVRGGSLTPPGALRFTCCRFCRLQIRVAGALGPHAGLSGACFGYREGLQGCLSPQIPTKPEKRSLGVGVKTQERTSVHIAREDLEMPCQVAPPAWDGGSLLQTPNHVRLVQTSSCRGYCQRLRPSRWGVQGWAAVGAGEQGSGGHILRRRGAPGGQFPEGS